MIRFFSLIFIVFISFRVAAQIVNPRPLTIDEYQKAKTFTIASLDNDTYVKFENTYILDRYEGKKPVFITGDDGNKKRIDLYKLVAKEGMQELGLMVFYTNEKSKTYQVLVPNFTADGKVWEKYFEDIHAVDKVEQNFILKLSYVLSRELSFQQFKNINGGKEIKDEHATYGNDICFPGDQLVSMKNGESKFLKDIKAGDEVISVDPNTQEATLVKVKELKIHEAKNYAVTQLVLIKDRIEGNQIYLQSKVVKATPNHPMLTHLGHKEIGKITLGEKVFCINDATQKLEEFKVLLQKEFTEGSQKVYNIEANAGSTLLLNGVMVKQK
ncbi:Hint domain-containing protein [Pedobacter cryophilus]|uniref:Hint domain-containing protein n=1 Tax=Pedobacter cryophilus TaxID=2571271 RepID=A0A4U1C0U7_9SPHI|nr:Hint domain-containing protein [Pedobacter cryophilus]TKB97700.1 hypothetical protein FA046_10055 [Pedobacter cryophilus]